MFSCFKPFKQDFCFLRDMWTLRNKLKGASKEVLASWVSAALEKSLTEKNVKSRFRMTGIFPFNPLAMDGKMGLSEFYRRGPGAQEEGSAEDATVDLTSLENLQIINEEYPYCSTFQSFEGGGGHSGTHGRECGGGLQL
jgi:hypothetical protein